MLIASRALLGVAGAAVRPSVLALVTGMFADERQRGRAIAVYLTCFMGGTTLGPLVGGVLLEYFWWGSVFLVAVPGIALLLAFGPALLPEQKASRAGKLDPVSVVLSLAAILPFFFGPKELARNGWEWLPAFALVFGIAVGVVFVRRQRRLEDPLLDLRLFGNHTFSSALVPSLVRSGADPDRTVSVPMRRSPPIPFVGARRRGQRMPVRPLTDAERGRFSGFPSEVLDEDLFAYFTLNGPDRLALPAGAPPPTASASPYLYAL